MIEAKRVDEKVNRIAEIVTGFFRKPGDQGDRRIDTVAIGAGDALDSLSQIEFLVNHFLQTLRTGLDAEEDTGASGARHQLQQLIIDTIGAGTATPGELLPACEYGLTKRHHLLAVDGVHVVHQAEIVE